MADPLQGLVVDAAKIDRERLAECLKGLMGIDGDTGKLLPLSGFEELSSAKLKVLTYLLGQKAAVLLGKADGEAVRRSQISEDLGVPDGTVGRVLRELAKDRLVSQDEDKRYMVPSHQLPRIHRLLREEVAND